MGGRAGEIAERIYCSCGRERHLADCSCSVARRMRKDLRRGVVDDKTDDEIIGELSHKYSIVKP